jgi:pSer/pThr/pTyr-binding forkhead associated (FHA) protein
MRPLEMPSGPTGFEPLFLVSNEAAPPASWPLSGSRVTVGRGLDNDIVLEDASVSRHHAELVREGTQLAVRDLGSTNGTWVNASRISAASIHPGDELAFGTVHLEVSRRPAE